MRKQCLCMLSPQGKTRSTLFVFPKSRDPWLRWTGCGDVLNRSVPELPNCPGTFMWTLKAPRPWNATWSVWCNYVLLFHPEGFGFGSRRKRLHCRRMWNSLQTKLTKNVWIKKKTLMRRNGPWVPGRSQAMSPSPGSAQLLPCSASLAVGLWHLRALSLGKMPLNVLPRDDEDTAPHSYRVCRDGPCRLAPNASTCSWACWLLNRAQLPNFLVQRAHLTNFLLQKRSGLQAAEGVGSPSKLLATDGL